MVGLGESRVERACLDYFEELSWDVLPASAVAPVSSASPSVSGERASYRDVLLRGRIRRNAVRLNPDVSVDIIDEALKILERSESSDLMQENLRYYRAITTGVVVQYADPATKEPRTKLVRLIDFEDPLSNDFVVVSQFSVEYAGRRRRADIMAFVNGLPLALFELKNPSDERADLYAAWRQIDGYTVSVPPLLTPNVICVISDGTSARMGPIGGAFEHYAPWKTIDGLEPSSHTPELETLVRGVFDPERLCEYIRDFVAYLRPRDEISKVLAKYHQFDAVREATRSVAAAIQNPEDKRAGVVWHTQGAGKSLEMLLLAGRLLRLPELGSPTIVIVTDRIDLDEQLHDETFAPSLTLPAVPVQATTRDDLRTILASRVSGGIVFTTMQKFGRTKKERDGNLDFPTLSTRQNIVVIADEAHRTQYDLKDGFAANLRAALPRASFLAFTGTPIAEIDRDTRRVFGSDIHIYDVTTAVRDGATVPLFYEARLAEVRLPEEAQAELNKEFADFTEGTEEEIRERLKSKWTRMEAVVGSDKRLTSLAQDIVTHWRLRSSGLAGKALIVGFSRRICIQLYNHIAAIAPEWVNDDDTRGKVKVVITGAASDGAEFTPHIRSASGLRALQERAKDPDDELELVIVRDMWLTGFDSPPMHTIYVDKPMRGAGLMQAIARVNRRFRDKPNGLIVDYIGIAASLEEALAEYSRRDRQQIGIPIDEARMRLLEEYEILCAILEKCPWRAALDSSRPRARLEAITLVMNFLLGEDREQSGSDDRKPSERFREHARTADRFFNLCSSDPQALAYRHDLGFFDDVAAEIAKIRSYGQRIDQGGIELALKRIVDEAVRAEGVVDIYAAAGIPKPDISILDEKFIEQLQDKPYRDLQIEAVRRIIAREVERVGRTNVVAEKDFGQRLEETLRRYRSRAITAAEVIAELVALAQDLMKHRSRGEDLGLSEQELAFYDAIARNGSAVRELGDATLRLIAHELTGAVRTSTTLDWQHREQVRAGLRRNVRRLLARYGYPPDRTEDAVREVVSQAERLAEVEAEQSRAS